MTTKKGKIRRGRGARPIVQHGKVVKKKTPGQKRLERRATAPARRRETIAARYGLDGDDDTEGYRPKTRKRGS